MLNIYNSIVRLTVMTQGSYFIKHEALANMLYIDKPTVLYCNCDISSGVWEAEFFVRRLIKL